MVNRERECIVFFLFFFFLICCNWWGGRVDIEMKGTENKGKKCSDCFKRL